MHENSNGRLRDAGKRLRLVGPCTARGRFRVILPLLRFRSRQAMGESPRVLLPSGVELPTFDELVSHRARQAYVSPRTVYLWLARFQNDGYAGLVDKGRRDRGIPRRFSKRPAVVAFVVTRYLEGWSVVAIHETLRLVWERLCRDDSPFPCHNTLRAFLKSMIPARVLARSQKDG